MLRLRLKLVVGALAALALWVAPSTSALDAQTYDTEVALSAFGGMTTDPGGFDVFRQTEFDPGAHVGGVLAFRLSPHLSVRGDIARAWSTGREGGVVNEDVDFNRTYFGVALEGRLPLDAVTPYVLAGGGLVNVDRSAPSQRYSFDTLGGKLGLGVAYPMGRAPIELFVEGTSWFYGRTSTGQGTQTDFAVSGGVTFLPNL